MYRKDFAGLHGLAVLHHAGWDIMPSVRPNFLAWCDAFGIEPRIERVFTSPAGTPVFEVYGGDGAGAPTGRERRSS